MKIIDRVLHAPRAVRIIAAIGVGGWLFRLWAVLVYRPTCDVPSATCYTVAGDAKYHHFQANLLAETGRYLNPNLWLDGIERGLGDVFVESAGDPPLFAGYLAGWTKIGFDGVTDHRVAATLWGFVLIVAVGLFTRRLAGNVAGVVAALLAALHPLMWINDMMLLSEGMYQPFVVLVFWAGYEWIREPSRRNIAILGVSIALATLIRAEALSLYAFMVLPLIWWVRTLDTREKLRQTVLCGVAGLIVMSPWLVYNNLRFEEPVTLSAVSGTVAMAGACDEAWAGPSLGFWANCFAARGLEVEIEKELPGSWREPDDPERIIYDESVRDAFNRDKALEYYVDNWYRYPKVALARMGRSLEFFRVGHSLQMNYRVEGRWEEPSTVGLGVYYALIPFTVIGALLLRRRGERLTPLLAMWPMIMFASAITFGLTRYRVPIDIAMIVLSAVALSWIFHRLRAEGVFRAVRRTPVES
jgi:4-amino-4-deoxy-L-arabinose transferase-like glycosyltransferase